MLDGQHDVLLDQVTLAGVTVENSSVCLLFCGVNEDDAIVLLTGAW